MKNESLLHVAYQFAFYNMVSEYGIPGGKAASILSECGIPDTSNPFNDIYELVEQTGMMENLRNEFEDIVSTSDTDFIDTLTATSEGKRSFYMVMRHYLSNQKFMYA